MFPIADILRQHQCKDVNGASEIQQLVFDLIVKYRKMKNRGVVAVFQRDRFDHYSNFARIGQGSLGGKGRGLAYIDSLIKKNPVCDNFDGVSISIPRSVVLCTDIFDEFMARNNLYSLALSDAPDDEILSKFLAAELPEKLIEDFYALFDVVDRPLAVRSSSLLEDSHYQPFAGIYSTYMIPHSSDHDKMFVMLSDAIKGVYASVFYAQSKAYMNATRNVIDQEKMAVIIQEVIGADHGGGYFPSFSGVGRSLNYYPINDEKAEDGVVQVAVGLGKYIVDGGRALRFSPRHPSKVLQTSTLDLALRETQTQFCALSDECFAGGVSTKDDFNIVTRNIQDFAGDKVLNYMVSTYDAANEMLIDNNAGRGRRVVTFANVLRDRVYPLASAVDFMLTTGESAMGRPVEIEFSGEIDFNSSAKGANKGRIYWLQIRPIIDKKDMVENSMLNAVDDEIILRSNTALGHGLIDAIHHIVYVRPENFNSLNNVKIAAELSRLNHKFIETNENYILIGPGRWGSSDNALGIPVKWPDISQARLIVESALNNYRIEPSQGTHFFQNLTSFGVGYFTIDPASSDGKYNISLLDGMSAEYESEYLRVVKFDNPLRIGIDGRKSVGVVLKPE
jgi:hypothetical protein